MGRRSASTRHALHRPVSKKSVLAEGFKIMVSGFESEVWDQGGWSRDSARETPCVWRGAVRDHFDSESGLVCCVVAARLQTLEGQGNYITWVLLGSLSFC